MRYAILNSDNIVINIIKCDNTDNYNPGENNTLQLVESACNIGWEFSEGQFTDPNESE